jgi:hypothetical protein
VSDKKRNAQKWFKNEALSKSLLVGLKMASRASHPAKVPVRNAAFLCVVATNLLE